jgi:hypothetical protein
MVVYHQLTTGFPVCNQNPMLIAIIIDCRSIRQRQIQVAHIPESRPESTVNDIVWNGMPTLADPPRHTGNRMFRRWKPKIIERHSPAMGLAIFELWNIGLA